MPSAVESPVEQPLVQEIDPEVQEELLNHPGKWAAITRSRVIAIGDSVSEVLKEAAKSGEKRPFIYRVPEGDRLYFF